MATQAELPRPIPGVLYGITHEKDGSLIIREPKILKVGIGLPKGPALSVWMQREASGMVKWKVTRGYAKEGPAAMSTLTCDNRQAAEELYYKHLPNAPECPYPRKATYFMFTKPSLVNGTERFLPDFDAIEAHGPTPTEIDIVLLDDAPFNGSYQMWSSSELRCSGDGITGRRAVSMAATPEEKELATAAIAAGEKYFPILEGCWTCGCRFSKETTDSRGKAQPSLCKPGGDLKFQLAMNLRVGGTAYFHTTGFRSISGIFSSLHRIRTLTGGRLTGIPLKMVLRPFRSNHNGQAATQYAVSLEFRAPDVEAMKQKLMESAFAFRELAMGTESPRMPVRLIDAPPEESPLGAAAIAAEFYPDEDGGDGDVQAEPVVQETGTAALAEKLKRARTKVEPAKVEPTVAAPAVAAPDGPAITDDDIPF